MPKRHTRKFRGGNVNIGRFIEPEKNYYSLDYEDVIQAERMRSELEKPLMNLPLHLSQSPYKPNKTLITKLDKPNVRPEPSQGGKPKKFVGGASDQNFQNIDITQFLISQWLSIPAHAGFPTTTLSIFNPCFTHLFDDPPVGGVVPSVYLCTCRVIYHYDPVANAGAAVPRPMNDAERDVAYRKLAGDANTPPIYIIGNQGHASSRYNDQHHYIVDPGSALATPWYNPNGNWGRPYEDRTMICLVRLTNTSIEGLDCFIPSHNGSCPVDARVFKVNQNWTTYTVFITGSSGIQNRGIIRTVGPDTNTIDPTSGDANFNGNFADEDSRPGGIDPGWKHGLVRLKYTFNADGTVTKTSIDRQIAPMGPARNWVAGYYTQETLADCTAWIGRIEKNYAMYYDPRGRMALNYHLTWGPSPNVANNTMVFYTKDYNGRDNDFETYDDRTWTVHRPPNSDIFTRIDAHYGNLDYMHWTCTSPFLLYNGELHAAGHMKIVFQKYLDRKLNEWIATGPANQYNYAAFEQYFDGSGPVPRDHLLHSLIEKVERFAIEQTRNPDHGVASVNGRYVRRILSYSKPNPNAGQPGEPAEIGNGQRIPYALRSQTNANEAITGPATFRPVFDYLVHKGFYVLNADGSISAPKNVHTDYLYYIFFYSVDPDDFHLINFSNPFMIEHEISAYLDFPVGLTQLGDNMLLSYGHGDCYSYLAKFPQAVYNGLLTHTNDTDINDIHYNLYNPTGGQYHTATLVAPVPYPLPPISAAALAAAGLPPAPPVALAPPAGFGAPATATGFAFAPPPRLAYPTQPTPARPLGYVDPFGYTPGDIARMKGQGGSNRKRNAKRKTRRIR
jgi:hypothetical protein